MPVDGVNAEQHGDAQTAMERRLLHLARVVAQNVQERTRTELRPAQRFLASDDGVGNLHHLGGFFFQCHLGKQVFHLLADGFVGKHGESSLNYHSACLGGRGAKENAGMRIPS